jgi:hypothetical protein
MNDVRDLVLRLLDEGFDREAWHGPNLMGALRGLDAEAALWRPAPGRHNAWEVALHCAYWKQRVRSRLVDVPREKFPHPGRDWPSLPLEPADATWREDLELLRRTHRALREAVASLDDTELARPLSGLKWPRIRSAAGIAMHDVYHAGQIRLLRRLAQAGAA